MSKRARQPFWKRLEHDHIKPALRRLKPWKYVTFGDIKIFYKRHLDGGGTSFGQQFIPLLQSRGMPRQGRVYEWCAGPGFIGFSILGHGLCDSLCLADINPDAVTACRQTVRVNGLADCVAVYRSDNLDDIPATEEWDLVVSNPPHFGDGNDLRSSDPGWNLHRRLFGSVAAHLKPGGLVILQENNNGSTAETFHAMIEQAGLTVVFVSGCQPTLTPTFQFYYLGIMRRGDPVPDWVTAAAW